MKATGNLKVLCTYISDLRLRKKYLLKAKYEKYEKEKEAQKIDEWTMVLDRAVFRCDILSKENDHAMVMLHLLRENNVSTYVEIYKRILKIAKR